MMGGVTKNFLTIVIGVIGFFNLLSFWINLIATFDNSPEWPWYYSLPCSMFSLTLHIFFIVYCIKSDKSDSGKPIVIGRSSEDF